ncbi:Cation-transporting ATPase [Fasciola gigantica]|uniref:Cation-transporting ATPase n=1 Tax=Fasciola gigantica TaxID=46835 RepID=A0A504Y5V5_FASGI|nr:Cation-transporting ATPase [Fasciola gigantica]
MLVYTGYFLTFGILRLLFHWIPYWILLSTHSVCPLSQAENVLIVDSSGIRFTHNVSTSLVKLPRNLRPNRKKDEDNSGLSNTYDELIFFIHKRLKYVWNSEKLHFELLSGWEERKYSEIFPVTPLSDEVVSYNRAIYGPNEIYLKLTPILVTLLSECLNPFYCFQIFSCALWLAEDYWTYASGILFISLISLITQVYEIRRNERALKETICGSALVTVCRETDGQIGFQQIDSTDLVPGDILEIPRNGCVMQCDALLLSGNCIVNESTLTGESVPVTKTPLPQRGDTKDEMFNLRAAARHVLFGGTSVIQTRNYADEKVLAVVARTSFRTAKGELVRAILFPKPLKFKFTQDAVKFVAALAVVALIGFCFSVYFMHRSGVETHMVIIRALDLITIAVPPALPMAMTIGIVFAQRRLRKQHIYCINPSVINVCGVINVTCFDKAGIPYPKFKIFTGTLTEDGLDLWGVVPCTTGLFEEPQPEPAKLARGPLLECMATCHSLTRIGGVLSGDPLDLKMFQSTKWEFMEQVDEDYRKFAMAVLSVVRPMKENVSSGFTCLLDALPEKMPYEAGIVRQFSFTSSLQRMSVIARVLGGQQFHVYTKGAPETIEFLCRPDTVPSNFHSVLLEYTRAGYRVLALAWRPLKVTYARAIKIRRERVEQDLSFLGLLIMENRLKPETAAVIEALRDANVRPIMVTGDNMLTALSVARDCVMIDELDRIVIVSAQPPTDHSRQEAGNNGREASSCSSSPHNKPLGDVHTESDTPPLVQFHYAEDLHKPVTEVTMTKRTAGLRYSKHKTKSFMFRHWFKSLCPRFESRDEYRTTPMVHDSFKPLSSPNIPQTTGVHLTIEHEPTVEIENMTAASHRVDIRILDRSDFHLAISGKTWAVIRDHYPWLIPKLVVKGTVFARFSPDQKAQLIEALQSVGYFVAMCGDGANDCGALKAAHAGVSLSEAEASVASPFTTKQQNISCIPTLIREGRCALVTSFGILKFMIGYSLVQFFSVVLMYYIGSKVSNGEFLYIDLFLITTISITCESDPYLPLFRLGPEYRYANYETTVVFIVSVYQYISLAIVFARGAPYRRSIVTNYMFIVNLVICTIFTVYVTTYPCSWLLNSFEMVRLSSVGFLIVLHLVVLANFLLCYLLEWGINRMAFRRLLLSIRHNLCPQYRKFKAYEEIREELDKLAGSWPPLIRSASVHTLPRDLFADGDIPARSSPEEKFRHRNPSEMSTDSENDDVTEPCQVPTFQDDDALLSSIAEPLEDMATPLIHSDIFQTTALPPTLVDRERNSTDDQD